MAPRRMVIEVPDDEDDLKVVDTNEQTRRRANGDGQSDNTAGFNDLKAQLESVTKKADTAAKTAQDERRARQQAEERERRAVEDARTARTEGTEGRRLAIENSLSAVTTAIDSLESEMASALEAGDFKKHASLNRRLQEAIVDQKNLEAGKSALAAEPKPDAGDDKRTTRQESKKPEPQTDEERFDQYVSQFTPAVQEWIREHPEVATDPAKNHTAIAGHHEAIKRGYKADSDEYFAYLDRKLGFRASEAARAIRRDNPIDDGPDADEPGEIRRSTTVRSAPVRGGSSGRRSSEVELTEKEVENATDGTIVWNAGNTDRKGKRLTRDDPRIGEPIGVEEMARRKRDMEREGRYAVPSL